MNNIYLIRGEIFENPELLNVDPGFFGFAFPGDHIKVKDKVYEILDRIWDPQEMDLYIRIDSDPDMTNPEMDKHVYYGRKGIYIQSL